MIQDNKTIDHISDCLKTLGIDKVNVISIRAYTDKNMVTIKLDNIITRSRILQN